MGIEVVKDIPFVAAKHFKRTNGRNVQYVVMHTMEAPEKGSTAEGVANYFARGSVVASAHYCIDSDSIVQCCQMRDVAYAAPMCNHNGVQIELAGYAKQSAADWSDPFSDRMLKNAAALCALIICPKYDIAVQYVSAKQLAAAHAAENTKLTGFTKHADVSAAFKRSTHWDPGPNFPMGRFLGYINAAKDRELVW
jgi:N-acetyl-anhydromuramyl-L-alanine amidase AmpD